MDSKNSSSALVGIESALTTLQPIRDLAQNWDIDIAAWYVDERLFAIATITTVFLRTYLLNKLFYFVFAS
jgi:hypothetical protein